MPEYIPPEQVTSPRRQWSLIDVLDDPKRAHKCVLALGRWNGKVVVAMRWNGDAENPVGNPQSRGLPTWFVVGDDYADPLIETLISEDKKALARNFIPKKESR